MPEELHRGNLPDPDEPYEPADVGPEIPASHEPDLSNNAQAWAVAITCDDFAATAAALGQRHLAETGLTRNNKQDLKRSGPTPDLLDLHELEKQNQARHGFTSEPPHSSAREPCCFPK